MIFSPFTKQCFLTLIYQNCRLRFELQKPGIYIYIYIYVCVFFMFCHLVCLEKTVFRSTIIIIVYFNTIIIIV